MNYDPNEMFRVDEEDLLLDEETQLQNDLLRQAAEEEKAKAAAAVEPTPQLYTLLRENKNKLHKPRYLRNLNKNKHHLISLKIILITKPKG